MKDKEEEHNKDGSNDDPIPLHVTVEILARLPVESLIKFQDVSKKWRSIIRSKYFTNSCLSISSTPSSRLLISFKNGTRTNKNPEKCLFFFTSSQGGDHKSSSVVANLDMKMSSMDAYFYIRCASINGFILISHRGRSMICNPRTSQVITLPEIKGTDGKTTYKYLGYDPVDNKYKALCKRFTNFDEDQDHMVLTIGGKKYSWRRIENTPSNYCPLTKGICINGFVYYGARVQRPNMSSVIVCFDVRSERLSLIKTPWSIPPWLGTLLQL